MLKSKCSPMPARTIYPHVAGLCRRLGTWRPKTERPLHSQEQTNKQSNVPFTSLGGVCVRACGSERKVAVLVPIGPRWRFIQNDRQDPYAGVLSKRPAKSLFGHTSHLTALRLRRVHVWMQVQHLLYTSERTSLHTITDVVVIYPTT